MSPRAQQMKRFLLVVLLVLILASSPLAPKAQDVFANSKSYEELYKKFNYIVFYDDFNNFNNKKWNIIRIEPGALFSVQKSLLHIEIYNSQRNTQKWLTICTAERFNLPFYVEYVIKIAKQNSTTYGAKIHFVGGVALYLKWGDHIWRWAYYNFSDKKWYVINKESVVNDGNFHHVGLLVDKTGNIYIYEDGVYYGEFKNVIKTNKTNICISAAIMGAGDFSAYIDRVEVRKMLGSLVKTITATFTKTVRTTVTKTTTLTKTISKTVTMTKPVTVTVTKTYTTTKLFEKTKTITSPTTFTKTLIKTVEKKTISTITEATTTTVTLTKYKTKQNFITVTIRGNENTISNNTMLVIGIALIVILAVVLLVRR